METGSRVEALNQLVRSIVTLGLCAGFIFGFIVLKAISGEVFTAVFSGVVGYWFASRDAKAATAAAVAAATQAQPQAVINPPPAAEPVRP